MYNLNKKMDLKYRMTRKNAPEINIRNLFVMYKR